VRAIIRSGGFDGYWRHHLAREYLQLYLGVYGRGPQCIRKALLARHRHTLRGAGRNRWLELLKAEAGNLAAVVRWYLARDRWRSRKATRSGPRCWKAQPRVCVSGSAWPYLRRVEAELVAKVRFDQEFSVGSRALIRAPT
jgi:hypothetical protein